MPEIGPMGLLKLDGPKLAPFTACPGLVEPNSVYLIEMLGLTSPCPKPYVKILYINLLRLSMTELGVQADRVRRGGCGRERSVTNRPGPALPDFNKAWCGGWGRERSVTDRPSPAFPDFDRPGPAWGVREGEVRYRQTRPGTPKFQPGPAWGWGRERSVTDKPSPALPDFDRPGPSYIYDNNNNHFSLTLPSLCALQLQLLHSILDNMGGATIGCKLSRNMNSQLWDFGILFLCFLLLFLKKFSHAFFLSSLNFPFPILSL